MAERGRAGRRAGVAVQHREEGVHPLDASRFIGVRQPGHDGRGTSLYSYRINRIGQPVAPFTQTSPPPPSVFLATGMSRTNHPSGRLRATEESFATSRATTRSTECSSSAK